MKDNNRLFQILSLLFSYPEEWLDYDILSEVETLENEKAAQFLRTFLEEIEQLDRDLLIVDYIRCFDFNETTNLYLTANLEERKRGQAMAELKNSYSVAGFTMTEEELPDYLPLVLEFCSLIPADSNNLLKQLRPALERLKKNLSEINSPYIHLLNALFLVME